LLSVLTHSVPQSVGVVPPQLRPHVLPLQTAPAAQALAHEPQWLRSVAVFTHSVPHMVGVVPPQVRPQMPA
jgi:hypothetical protein